MTDSSIVCEVLGVILQIFCVVFEEQKDVNYTHDLNEVFDLLLILSSRRHCFCEVLRVIVHACIGWSLKKRRNSNTHDPDEVFVLDPIPIFLN